jgi:methyltransferase-like protein
MEQYLDFLRNRTFRQTLIVHEHQRPTYNLGPERVQPFLLASPAQPKAPRPDLAPGKRETFVGPAGGTIDTAQPLTKAMLVTLGELWPRAVPLDELRRLTREKLGMGNLDDLALAVQDKLALSQAALSTYAGAAGELLELSLWQPPFTTRVSERPEVSALARLEAAERPQVTNQLHQPVQLDEVGRHLLVLIDGRRTVASLLQLLVDQFHQGTLTLNREGRRITDRQEAETFLAEILDNLLRYWAKKALLVA